MQQQDVDVAVRVQLAASVAADGDECVSGQAAARVFRERVDQRGEDVPVQRVQHDRTRVADFAAAAGGAMQHLEPRGLDL
jgi:hypothetical protein